MIKQNKKGAMEMSMGMIVTIVLIVSVMIIGLVLIQKIGKSATGAIDLTDQQLQSKINEIFSDSEDQRSVLFPRTGEIEIKKGKSDAVGIMIINQLESLEETFSFETSLADKGSCNMDDTQLESFIDSGGSRASIRLASGDKSNALKIFFKIPESATLCSNIIYQIDISKGDGTIYHRQEVVVTIE